jgi:hypothetical protein
MKNFIFYSALVFSFTLLIISHARADLPETESAESNPIEQLCPDKIESFGDVQIQQTMSSDNTSCFLSIHPRDSYKTMVYRDYLLSNDGLIMVFNSYSNSESSNADGAREFFLLPQEFTGYTWTIVGSELVVSGFSGRQVKFLLSNAQVSGLTDAVVQVADQVLATNAGGVEITKTSFPMIDAGFRMGDSPSIDQSRSSILRNSNQETCRVKNPKVFQYKGNSVLLKSVKDLQAAAKATCPGFDFE